MSAPQQSTVDDAELAARLRQLTLEQKVRLLTGADIWALYPEPAIGLRRVVTSDGPAGVRGERWDERLPSANIPSPTALAASWDTDRLARMGRLLAVEARRKGVDVLLAPTVNLHRSPYGGRHFECLSEDPLLSAALGAAYVRGVQDGGVAATVKHLVGNDAETDRLTVDVRMDERTLREVYLRPFEAAVAAGAWAVMAAYNSVNGTTMTENHLLRDVLKDEWSFDGVVISDWHATRSLAAAGSGLVDLVMPGPGGPWGDALVAAVRRGELAESAVDDHVLRLLRLAARVGALDGVPATVGSASSLPDPDVATELRAAASAGFVLASNRDSVLPFDPGALRRIAVLGPNSDVARTMGGGSATVFPPYTVSPLDGLRAAFGAGTEVVHATGGRLTDRLPVVSPDLLELPDGSASGVDVRFLAADGTPLGRQHRHAATLFWWGPIQDQLDASQVDVVELRTRLRVPQGGRYSIGASGLGHFTLSLDGSAVLDTAISAAPGADLAEDHMRPPQRHVEIRLSEGRDVAVLLRYRPARASALGGVAPSRLAVALNLARHVDDQAEFDRAVTLAADADAAVVVVGTTEEVESEGFDRERLALPGRQDDLVRAVAAVNPRTVVVVNAGAPVLLPWADDVAAVLIGWFAGQEFGNALADVLLGRTEPGGRLPTTWPAAETGHPPVVPVDGQLRYDEGLFVGYRAYHRAGRRPRYPFGHGLGYTDWTYQSVSTPGTTRADEDVTVAVEVTNTGRRPGRDVIQVYLSKPGSAVTRPVRWLAGFTTVHADPGQTVHAEIRLPARAFQHWDESTGWNTEAGVFGLHVGRSADDLLLSTELRVATAAP